LKVVVEEDKKSWPKFSLSEIGNTFACTSTTSAPMDKRMVQAYSEHQIGLNPTLQALLIVGW
jgi:hypothetical protein